MGKAGDRENMEERRVKVCTCDKPVEGWCG
jgi:hypothetical protein